MIEKTRTVFYCSHCKRHGLSRHAMVKHELHCTMNPERTCRWKLYGEYGRAKRPYSFWHEVEYGTPPVIHTMSRGLVRWAQVFVPRFTADWSTDDTFIKQLREHALGCPACMLAAIRQANIDRSYLHDGDHIWDYQKEVERYRQEEREHWQCEATFL